MPTGKPVVNFAGGEASPKIKGRIDVEQYYAMGETLLNVLVSHYGTAFNTPGTKFSHRTKYVAKKTRFIPFVFSSGDSYILEFGDKYIRFHTASGSVMKTAVDITDATQASPCVLTCNTATLANGDAIDITGVLGMTELNGKRYLVANKTSTTIEITDEDGNDIDSTGFTAYDSAGTLEAVYEVVSPYDEDDLADIKYTQNGDVIYLFVRGYEQRKLSRLGAASWTIAAPAYDTLNWPAFKDINTTATTITPSGTTGSITLTASASLFNANHVGSYWRIDNTTAGYVKITAVGSATSATATVISTLASTNATDDWYEGAWSADEGYPVDGVFFEQRLVVVRDLKFWGSEIGAYDNYDNGTDDDATEDTDPFKYTIGANQTDSILWVYATTSLILGTAGGPFIASSGSSALPITPTNITVKQMNEDGASSVSPVRVGSFVNYILASGTKLGQLAYSIDYDSYDTEDITYLNDHILSSGVVEIAVQKSPYHIIWCVLEDGTLATLTRQVKNNVRGWTRQVFTGAEVENVGIIPNGAEDQVWIVVKRTINGSVVRHIEYFMPHAFSSQLTAFFLRDGLTYLGGLTTTITGLEHLEGETVKVIVNGGTHPDKVVSGGSITLEWAGTNVHVGLYNKSTIKTMDLANGHMTHISKVIVRLYNSLGCTVGNGITQDVVPFSSFGDLMGTPPALFTGDKEVQFPSGHVKNQYIVIEQENALPMHVLGIFPDYLKMR